MAGMVFSALATAAALAEGLRVSGESDWQATTPEQNELVALLPPYTAALADLGEYVQAISALTAEEINAWLAAQGFPSLKLKPWPAVPPSFGIAATTDIALSWLKSGSPEQIESPLTPDVTYPAVLFGRAQRCRVLAGPSELASEPVIVIHAHEELQVRLMVCERPASVGELLTQGQALLAAEHPLRYSSAVVPMVQLDQQPDISWLRGLRTGQPSPPDRPNRPNRPDRPDRPDRPGQYWEIAQAVMQVKFGLNLDGARVREAMAAQVMLRGAIAEPEPTYYVDRPFLLTVSKNCVAVPIFTAYIDTNEWADPGDLAAL